MKAPAQAGAFIFGGESPYHRPMEHPAPRVALVGLMGAGKSLIGRQVAALLGWPFFDADLIVEERTGSSIEDLFRQRGEAAFRRLEADVLVALSGNTPPLVAALGGGVVERPENRALLRASFRVVWLQVDPDRAAERLGRGVGRPLLAGREPLAALRELHARREPWYREVAHDVVDVNTVPAADAGRALAALLQPH